MTDGLAALNSRFGIDGHVVFREGPGGLTVADVSNEAGRAEIALFGGHVMRFQPAGHRDVLWMSRESVFQVGEPIRGGIPVCWPWFGGHPSDPGKPTHGFARRFLWEAAGSASMGADRTQLTLQFRDTDETRAMWDHAFETRLAVTVGSELSVSLTVRNGGTDAFTCTGALHTYFSVSHIADVSVSGLEGTAYIDTVGGANERSVQNGPITFAGETDGVFLDTTTECVIHDPTWGRRIRIAKEGSRSTVVWNPWAAKSKRMPDFGDDEYVDMLCVETANAVDDSVMLAPGETHCLLAVIGVE